MASDAIALPVLRADGLAYFDSLIGAIPCRVNTIVSENPEDRRPGSWQEVTATVTETCGAYKKGDKVNGHGFHFFPRASLGGRFKQHIKPYRVQA
jgi:hypothetical protein